MQDKEDKQEMVMIDPAGLAPGKEECRHQEQRKRKP